MSMQRTTPPFRADHVGSLLRPAPLKEARARRERGEITAPKRSRRSRIARSRRSSSKQEEVGLKSITDGEFRRAFWNYDFLERLDGVESYLGERKIKFQGPQPKPMMLRVIGKLGGYKPHPMIEHFKFLKAHTRQTPKMTIPSPSSLHFRYGRDAVPETIYPSMDDFYRDLGQSYRKAVRAFADAGCRYLQLDEVNFAYLCDPKLRELIIEPRRRSGEAAGHLRPHDQRGDFRHSRRHDDHHASVPRQFPLDASSPSGGYEPVAETLFNTINVHGYFMEYDSERAGGFEPLRFVPKDKTGGARARHHANPARSKAGRDQAPHRRRPRNSSLDQLCLSPQCGFASTEEGNILAEDEQWAKLRMIVEIAEEVWG